MKLFRRVTACGLLAAMTLGLSLRAEALENISVRLKWFNQAQFAGFYVAKEKGFYQEGGLEVTLNPGGPDFPSIQMVAGGSEQFGVAGADQVLVGRGKGVPVVAVAALYRKSPFVLFSLKNAGIDQPQKFTGKRIGVKIGGNEELLYRAVLKKAGVDSKALSETPVKFDMTPLLTGQLDVWPGYTINEVLSAQEKGFDVNVISPADFGINVYADTLFTTEKLIEEKPDLVRRFVAATIKGWNYAIANPEEAARMTLKYGPKLTYEHELAMMKASVPLLAPDKNPIGSMQPAVWNDLQGLLLEGKFLKKPLELNKAYTTGFLPK
jgi:ABC-type nitrate/sulfonate/bicarbonate transport system substrate-binding protein